MTRPSVLLVLLGLAACDSTPAPKTEVKTQAAIETELVAAAPVPANELQPEPAVKNDAVPEPDGEPEPGAIPEPDGEPALDREPAPDAKPEPADKPLAGGSSGTAAPTQLSVVKAGIPTVEGELDKITISKVVRSHITEVRTCYIAGLARNPLLAGSMTIAFEISATGTVTSSSAAEPVTFAEPNVISCVTTQVKTWKFPKPAAGVVHVTQPFVLAPS